MITLKNQIKQVRALTMFPQSFLSDSDIEIYLTFNKGNVINTVKFLFELIGDKKASKIIENYRKILEKYGK